MPSPVAWQGLQMSPRAGTGQAASRAPGRAFLAPRNSWLPALSLSQREQPSTRAGGWRGRRGNHLQKDVPCFFWGFIFAMEGKGAGLVRFLMSFALGNPLSGTESRKALA